MDYWNEQAAELDKAVNSNEALSSKELKREGFGLARKRYEVLEPVMERLKELDFQRQERMERTTDKGKDKEKKKKSRHGR